MEFKVNFLQGDWKDELYRLLGTSIGTDKIEEVRKKLDLNIPLNLFNGYVGSENGYSKVIQVSEKMAFDSGVFKEHCFIDVRIKSNNSYPFNKYFKIEFFTKKNKNTGEILEVYFSQEIDEVKVIKDWEEAGFPLEWDLSEEITTKTP